MAVDITIAALAEAIRVGDEPEETAEVTRLRDYSILAISTHLDAAYEDTPAIAVNMATALLTGFYYDKPTVSTGVGLANAMKFSGAIRVLLPYRIIGAGLVGGDAIAAAQAAVGTEGNPVTDVAIVGDQLVITFADGSTESHTLPAGGGGIDTVAVQTLIDAHAAMPEIHHVAGGGGGRHSVVIGNITEGRLPGAPIAMRMGWGETNPPIANVFTRDDNHPQDGAAVGTSDLTYMPPFPPALAAEHSLYVFIWLEGTPAAHSIVVNPGLDRQGDFSGFFTDGEPLEVEGVAGTVYVSLFKFSLNESQGYASPQPGLLLATQTWVTGEIANIMLSGGGITTAQAQALIDAAVVGFQTDTQVSAIVAAALTALPNYQTLAEVNALIAAAIAALTPGQTAAQVAALITLHAAMPSAHHVKTPEGGGGGGGYTSLATGALASNQFLLNAAGATAIANVLIDGAGDYIAIVGKLEDFARHQNFLWIPLGLEDYGEGVNHEFYGSYVNNSSGVVSGMRLSVRRNSGVQAVVSVNIIGTGTIDAGTGLTLYGES